MEIINSYLSKFKKPYGVISIVTLLIAIFPQQNGWSQVNAQSGPSINVVEIANFFCPYCYLAQQAVPELRKIIAKHGGKFDFFPLAWGEASIWPTNIYLSMPPTYQDQAAEIFFNLAQLNGLKMESVTATCVALNQQLVNLNINDCERLANNKLANTRINNAWKLLNILNQNNQTLKLPIFIIEKGNQIIKIISRAEYDDMHNLVTAVMYAVESAIT